MRGCRRSFGCGRKMFGFLKRSEPQDEYYGRRTELEIIEKRETRPKNQTKQAGHRRGGIQQGDDKTRKAGRKVAGFLLFITKFLRFLVIGKRLQGIPRVVYWHV